MALEVFRVMSAETAVCASLDFSVSWIWTRSAQQELEKSPPGFLQSCQLRRIRLLYAVLISEETPCSKSPSFVVYGWRRFS
jgi:hypothetical protein